MNLTGAYIAVLFPRVFFDLLHYTGKLIRLRRRTHIRALSNTGIILWIVIFIGVVSGSIVGKFHFTTENVTIKVKGLKSDLDGLIIVQISDVHLSTFYKHKDALKEVMERINSYHPDIIINSGDFIEYGYREFERSDTIFSIAHGKYGSFAVLGNHDIGTYYPGYKSADIDTNIKHMSDLITASGYRLLKDENIVVKIGSARLGIAGTVTRGRFPVMKHGDLAKAIAGLDSADFKILISHDPNHWKEEVTGKTNIDLTLSGHTHGMQMGIITKKIRWSPSEYFYHQWNGLYTSGNQFLYVNRGLGVIVIPFRIFMPPEITVIKLERTAE
jgi:predicted MPP superfamily phosphohydrolase